MSLSTFIYMYEHYKDFENTKAAWLKIITFLKNNEIK